MASPQYSTDSLLSLMAFWEIDSMRKRRSHATPVLVLAVVYVGVGVLTYSLTLGAIDYLLGLNAANKEPGIPFGPLAYSRSGYELSLIHI